MSVKKVPSPVSIARVIVSPPATTLAQSTAILRELQAFGPVTSFHRSKLTRKHTSRSPDNGLVKQEIEVTFSDPETTQMAVNASPFTVNFTCNVPNPQVEDPFNLRCLKAREVPRSRTMMCRVEPHIMKEFHGQNALSKGFSPNTQTRLHQSLLDMKPPPAIADGLGVLQPGKSDILDTTHLVERPPDLMTMYRQPHKQADQQFQNEDKKTRASTSIDV
ncbi:hypothetical protein PV08_10575 [Exophiala spinifera]|uniref:Uncharacterized protein n=1 Tax=Exophiala spinifera TaxID=91928 RepID=A0A0D2AXV2_9EURO|nr:uncharacterized protein PV08_10575 [Exophiala spinifera]KIW11275.1 hypothetical protein PV08_10575 [Exophiala spinifera]